MKKWIMLVLAGACMLILGGCSKAKEKPAELTLETVKELAKKGAELTWSDFEQYESTETGSGMYILAYKVDENYELWIGGGSLEELPMYIRLVSAKNKDTYIDIRTDNIDDFIGRQGSVS